MQEISESKWYRISPGLPEILILGPEEKKRCVNCLKYCFKVDRVELPSGDSLWKLPFHFIHFSGADFSEVHGRWLVEVEVLDPTPTEDQWLMCGMLGLVPYDREEDQK